MTEKTRADLATEIATLFADNTSGDITEADLRANLNNILDSFESKLDDNTAAGATTSVPKATRYGDLLTPRDFGIAPNTFDATNAAKVLEMLQSGKSIRLPQGFGGMPWPDGTITSPISLYGAEGAYFKPLALADGSNDGLVVFGTGAEGSVLEGVRFDGNRAALLNLPLTGTWSWSASATTMTGSGGAASSEVVAGDYIRIDDYNSVKVVSVSDNNTVNVETALPGTGSGEILTYNKYRTQSGLILVSCENVRFFDIYSENVVQWTILANKAFEVDTLHCENSGGIIRLDAGAGLTIDKPLISNVTGKTIGHNGIEFNRHSIQLWRCTDFLIDACRISGMYGNIDTPFVSGITSASSINYGRIVDCEVLDFNSDCFEVGISVGMNTKVINSIVRSIAGTAIETKGGRGTRIINPDLDGMYRGTVSRGRTQSVGISNHAINFLDDTSRSSTQPADITVEGGIVRRFGIGLDSKGIGSTYKGVTSNANLLYGAEFVSGRQPSFNYTSDFTYPQATLESCTLEYNRYNGIYIDGMKDPNIINCIIKNNGQAGDSGGSAPVGTTNLNLRSNIGIVECYGEFGNIVGNDFRDTQGFTAANALSYVPGSPTTVNSYSEEDTPITKYRHTFSVGNLQQDCIAIGQNITITDAGGNGVNITGFVVDRNEDEIIVESDASTARAVGSNNLVNLTGTWGSSGTALTGSGGDADGDLPGAYYIKHPTLTEYELVTTTDGNNSITIDEAFSANFSAGSTVAKVAADAVIAKTALVGLKVATTNPKIFIKDNETNGCVDGPMSISGSSIFRAGSEFSRYWSVSFSDISAGDILLENNLRDGSRITGYRSLNGTAWNNSSGMSLVYTNSGGGSVLATIKSGLTMTAGASNIKSVNNVVNDDGQVSPDIRVRFAGTAPTAGNAYWELLYTNTQPDSF